MPTPSSIGRSLPVYPFSTQDEPRTGSRPCRTDGTLTFAAAPRFSAMRKRMSLLPIWLMSLVILSWALEDARFQSQVWLFQEGARN